MTVTVRIQVEGVPGVPDGTYCSIWTSDSHDTRPEIAVGEACAFQAASIVRDRCEKKVREA